LAFLDEEEQLGAPPEPERPRRRDREVSGPGRRRQQYLVRRLIAVGVGLAFLILVVIAFRGCLEARSDRGLRNYTQDISTIMQESQQRGEEFFDSLENPGGLSEQEVEQRISAIRGASASLLDRAESAGAPDQMREAQSAVTQSLELRRDALDQIAANIGQATADTETANPIETITTQMGSLYASDILWTQLAAPEITDVLGEEGVDAPDLPPGNFMPESDPTQYLDPATVTELLTGISGDTATAGGLHGLELVSTTLGDTTLSPDSTNTVADDAREVTVEISNGGDSDETTSVAITLNGDTQERDISVTAGDSQEVNVQFSTLPQPGAQATLDVVITPVPGEEITDNNESHYTVVFGSA
jgi:hypothetical protein